MRLIGDADDVFNLFDATIEFPPEDAGDDAPADKAAPDAADDRTTQKLAGKGGDGLDFLQGDDDVVPTSEQQVAATSTDSPNGRIAAAGWYAVRVAPGSVVGSHLAASEIMRVTQT